MKKLNILIMLLMILIFSFSVSASYQRIGKDLTFNIDDTDFNADVTATVTGSQLLTNQINQPARVSDLDGDGTAEIIFLDFKTLTLYQNNTLDVLDGAILPSTSNTLSNIEVFDIDGDGTKEIIIASGDKEIYIYDLENNNDLNLTKTLIIDYPSYGEGSILVSCRDRDECIWIANDEDSRFSTEMRVGTFNSINGTIATVNILSTAPTNEFTCFSKIPNVQQGNLDDQGDDEFIISYIHADISGSEEMNVVSIWVNNSNMEDVAVLWTETLLTNGFSNEQTCSLGGYEDLMTAPLTYNFKLSNGDLDETVVGYLGSNKLFMLMVVLDPGGVEIIKYPLFLTVDAGFLSNPFLANTDWSTGLIDFCIAGEDFVDLNIMVFCSSLESKIAGSNAFEYIAEIPYNYSIVDKSWTVLSHSVQADEDDMTEVLTMFGIYDLDYSSCDIDNECEMSLIYSMPKINGTVIISDMDNTAGDIIVSTPTNLWYIDDGFVNSPANVEETYTNPCLNGTWKENTTVNIRVTVTDIDSDLVNARAILYYSDTNEQDSGWSINATSGTAFSFSFIANKSLTTAQIRVMGRDVENPSDVDTKDYSFSVAVDGLEFGDCTSTFDYETDIDLAAEIDEIGENDTIDSFIDNTKSDLGLTMSNAILWLLFMAIVTGAILWGGAKEGWDPKVMLMGVSIFNIIMIVLATAQGIFSPTLIFIILILFIGAAAAFYRKTIFGGG